MKVGVIGAGAWGKALSILSEKAGNETILWAYNSDISNLDGINIPKTIKTTGDLSDLNQCEIWIIATPSTYFRETLQKCNKFYNNQPVIICTKGIESKTYKFMSEILKEELPQCINFGVLSGPQFAKEVAQGMKTGSTLAGNTETLKHGRSVFSELFLEETDDIIGTEICGTGKNAISLITGFLSVKTSSENEKALLFTLAWGEVVKFGLASEAKLETFMGLCGLGDLFLSATSCTSRNYSAGVTIANKSSVSPEITAEGINALLGIINRANEINSKTPVLTDFYNKMKFE